MPWAARYDVHEFTLSAGGPLSATSRRNWNFGASDSSEGEVVRGNHFDGAARLGQLDNGARRRAPTLFVTARYAESSRAGFPDDSGGYEFAAIRDTEKRDADEAVFGAGVNTRVGNATFGADGGILRSRRPHRLARRRARHSRSIRRAAERGRHQPDALLGHAHRHAEVFRFPVAGLRRRLAARARQQRRHAGFRRRVRAAHVVRPDAHLVGAVRRSAPRVAHRTLRPGRRARRPARRHGLGHQPARARGL